VDLHTDDYHTDRKTNQSKTDKQEDQTPEDERFVRLPEGLRRRFHIGADKEQSNAAYDRSPND